jgi:hypothetical protein
MMLNGEVGSTARANVAMTVMLCVRLPDVVFGCELRDNYSGILIPGLAF